MTLLVFIVMLSILIGVHEWGHYITAKKNGVRVDEFALGFGWTLWSYKGKETEFKICAIPLGGYVKMAGDEREQCQGESWEYYSKTPGQRAAIVFMGPAVNFVFAYLCFYAVFMMGQVNVEQTIKNMEVRIGHKIGSVLPDHPAAEAGLQAGDEIVQINDEEIKGWLQMSDKISASKGEEITLTVLRGEETFLTRVRPQATQKREEVFVIGIAQERKPIKDDLVKAESAGVIGSFTSAASELWTITKDTYIALGQIITHKRSAKEMTGPIGIYGFVDFAMLMGISFLVWVVGVISASLAIFNLIPMAPLDGGHLLLLACEKIKGSPLPKAFEHWFMRIGLSLMLMLALFVFYVDFERIGIIEKIMGLFK